MTTSSTASPSAPTTPWGQGTTAPGRDARQRETSTSQAQAASAGQTSTLAPHGHQGATRVARRPDTVATGTGGAATTLAGTAHTPTAGRSMTRTGAQAAWATRGSATRAASQRGRYRPRAACALRAPSRIPPVAATDRANP